MASSTVGAVVTVTFPFSDLSETRRRPAVVLARAGATDWILCQITSNAYGDARSITLDSDDFASGSLRVTSYARPGKLFTANATIITSEVGVLKADALNRILDAVIAVFRP